MIHKRRMYEFENELSRNHQLKSTFNLNKAEVGLHPTIKLYLLGMENGLR